MKPIRVNFVGEVRHSRQYVRISMSVHGGPWQGVSMPIVHSETGTDRHRNTARAIRIARSLMRVCSKLNTIQFLAGTSLVKTTV